ncbi:MAG: bifunctional oligoribonuclease/PAP phosphatase NrnA [Lentisphaerae bacterium]|jgi:phosphoesterase RecJ-like protein|nr:bifunctional oligoribonuclease/PAP phosphatase NrnA [Lentisphaerota bacterium]
MNETLHNPMAPVLARLDAVKRIVITAHVRPDGDALGSALALAGCLRHAGKHVQVALDRDEIGVAAVLEGVADLTPTDAVDPRAGLLVVVDCAAVDRMPEALQPLVGQLPTVVIDHHPTNTRFGDIQWVDPAASSTGEMIWRLARQAGWKLDRRIAEALWVALITDTGRFAYECTSSTTMTCAADLLTYDVRTAWLNEEIYLLFDWRVLQLRKRAYDSLESWQDGRVTVVSLTYEDFAATGCTKADAEDIIEIPRMVRGSQVALFIYQTEPRSGVTRVSIRTRQPLDAILLARRYGGGGHRRASGATLPFAMAEARLDLQAAVAELYFS